ncbi:uncharacterized protein EI90DRAFT_3071315 [Cantharellus anzutake]|uniref:uncharacterized protein n=1 Tax=Cantharellus anzutake TaxID=1750568 RepID=UPI0019066FD3|nr:uncharacterized protein EI90DRAFT_3071315 [Cantharellus anzutake]KAF8326050.1 hypothetical protein EI90DRAFT_3071315 [Cantharellus anzutake]
MHYSKLPVTIDQVSLVDTAFIDVTLLGACLKFAGTHQVLMELQVYSSEVSLYATQALPNIHSPLMRLIVHFWVLLLTRVINQVNEELNSAPDTHISGMLPTIRNRIRRQRTPNRPRPPPHWNSAKFNCLMGLKTKGISRRAGFIKSQGQQ